MKRALTLSVWCLLLTACICSSSEAQTVYITNTGAKYHVSSCRYLRYSKIAIGLREAKERGYTPCSVCHPVTASDNQGSASPSAPRATEDTDNDEKANSTVSSQCTAITKAGTRCKRTASTNGRCWQHQ